MHFPRSTLFAAALALVASISSQAPIVDLDSRTLDGDSNPRAGVSVGGVAYFVATTAFGPELWRSDGTSVGTYMLKDVMPGDRGSAFIRDLTVVGNQVFFAAAASGYGAEIWVTDGTPLGTRLVKDILTGSGQTSAVNSLIRFGGKLYFVAADGRSGNDLWETDGTDTGTRRVTALTVGPITQAAVGNNAFYFAGLGSSGYELWRSDGTSAGTREVANLTRSGSTLPRQMTVVGGQVFFVASSDLSGGAELHVSDGTAAGTRLVREIRPGAQSSFPDDLIALGNKCLVFTANDGVHGEELWRSDGTAAGTYLLKDIRTGAASGQLLELTAAGSSRIVFSANDGANGIELWSTDGTVSGTVNLDLLPGRASSQPQGLASALGFVFFRASTPSSGRELWISNGTRAGTVSIDVLSGPGSSSPHDFTVLGNRVLFSASTSVFGGATEELHITDGTPAGTRRVHNIWLATLSSNPSHVVGLGNRVFFRNGATARPWVSDGSAPGTAELSSTISVGNEAVSWRGRAWFEGAGTTGGWELYESDGSAAGTKLAVDVHPGNAHSRPADFTVTADRLFFTAAGPNGRELYATDGTQSGTTLLDVRRGVGSSSPAYLTAVGDRVFFGADDGSSGFELWISDGTVAGTRKLELVSGPTGSSLNELAAFGNRVFFSAISAGGRRDLHCSDGTVAGTRRIQPTVLLRGPQNMTEANGLLFFDAIASTSGRELWVTDGTDAGTRLVRDLRPGFENSGFGDYVGTDCRLYFFANNHHLGLELWTSDGTAAGTRVVRDLMPGSGTGVLEGTLTRIPGTDRVVFVGSTSEDGWQLFESDGSATGTRQIGKIGARRGAGAATIGHLTPFGSSLFFAADSGPLGNEPWIASLEIGQRPFAASYGHGCPGTGGFVPAIGTCGNPVLGNGSFRLSVTAGRPAAPTAVLLGAAPASTPLGSCRLLVVPAVTTPTVLSNGLGSASTALPIPAAPTLLGGRLFGQYVVIDPRGSFQNFAALSDGVMVKVGR